MNADQWLLMGKRSLSMKYNDQLQKLETKKQRDRITESILEEERAEFMANKEVIRC